MPKKLSDIAAEIKQEIALGNWSLRGSATASPYLIAMQHLDTINDKYFCDSGKSIVLYFLANAGSWRGETARRIKAELKALASG